MTKSRRVMAVIVAALLIAAMILPGLVVKDRRSWPCGHEGDD